MAAALIHAKVAQLTASHKPSRHAVTRDRAPAAAGHGPMNTFHAIQSTRENAFMATVFLRTGWPAAIDNRAPPRIHVLRSSSALYISRRMFAMRLGTTACFPFVPPSRAHAAPLARRPVSGPPGKGHRRGGSPPRPPTPTDDRAAAAAGTCGRNAVWHVACWSRDHQCAGDAARTVGPVPDAGMARACSRRRITP